MGDKSSWVKWFSDLSNKDISIAGGKGASLAEMYNHKFPVPPGFIVTAQAYDYFIEKSGVRNQIFNMLNEIDVDNTTQLETIAKKIRHLIEEASMPEDMKLEISEAYEMLDVEKSKFYGASSGALAILKNSHEPPFVAVRSSATMEDLADASFAGQQESFLNVKGVDSLIDHVKKCFASLFTARAIYYRKKKGFANERGYLAVVVQKMIDSQKSGVMFSKNPLKNDGNIIIEAVFGLGEGIVSGMISPDHYVLNKKFDIVDRTVSDKKIALTRNSSGKTEEVKLSPEISNKDVLTNHELKVLSQYAIQLEEHYGKPQDIEFAIDDSGIFIVQSRPITTKSYDHVEEVDGNVLFSGLAASPGIASGIVKIVHSLEELSKINKGNVLVTKMTNPDMVVAMARSVAIITDEGGSTCFEGSTKVLTNKGFTTIKEATELVNAGNEIKILAYNSGQMKPCWKRVISAASRKRNAIQISVSQKGSVEDNNLTLTPDHKMITFENRKLIKEEVKNILTKKEHLCIVDSLPLSTKVNLEHKAYLMGCLFSDGFIGVDKYSTGNPHRGRIIFTQKNIPSKQEFIATVRSYFEECLGDSFNGGRIKYTNSYLRGRLIQGSATDYICCNLVIATEIMKISQNLDSWVLLLDENSSLSFLAGLIDGDGCLYQNRLHIYVGKENVLQGVILACLNLGIFPQITKNRTIHHVQILERILDILKFTKRVSGFVHEKILGNKLFAAKNILSDIIDSVNYKGRIKPYVQNNLLLDSRKIAGFVMPIASAQIKEELSRVINSGLRMQRLHKTADIGEVIVYNLEIEADTEIDHNFVVFTSKYTPILVSNSHAAIVSREMGIPAVVGTHSATTMLKDGQIVTVDGFTGRILEGKSVERKVEIKKMLPTKKTKIKVIVDLPDYAPRAALCGATGIGLVRLETLIATSGKHPVWFIKKNKLNEYVSILHKGLRKIAQPFNEIWIRTSDIRSDEYQNLEGAPEVNEMNPMLGDHGIRFSLKNEDLLVAEFTAIKELADEYGKKIFGVMFPQIISVEELKTAKKIAEKVKFPSNVKIGIMIETPAAVQIINDLCEEGMNFVSFGTNDLTQYTLAIDRNNEDVQDLYTELHPAVLNSIAYVIRRCKKYGIETSICGQAGSKPEMVRFLLKEGIDSISVNADAAHAVSVIVNEIEDEIISETPIKHIKHVNTGVKIKRVDSMPHALESSIAPRRNIPAPMGVALQASEHASGNISHDEVIMKNIESWSSEEGDYNPGKGVSSDVPSLNDSISVSSEDFAPKTDTEFLDLSSTETKSDLKYEAQQDVLFNAIVSYEVENNPAFQKLQGDAQNSQELSLE